ncbi:MAG: response regulator [Nitrospinota bacterium]
MPTKLLLADDSVTIQRVVELAFENEDVEVTTVGDGLVALEKLKESRPDIIIADVTMPGLNGFELCTKLKDTPEYHSIPILLLTGLGEIDKEKYDLACSDGYISKPFKSEELIEKVRGLLRGGVSPPSEEVQTGEWASSEENKKEETMDIIDNTADVPGEAEINPEEEAILKLQPDDEITDAGERVDSSGEDIFAEGKVSRNKDDIDIPDFSMEGENEADKDPVTTEAMKEMELAEEEKEELLAEFNREGIEEEEIREEIGTAEEAVEGAEELESAEEEALLADTDTEEETEKVEEAGEIEEEVEIKEEKNMDIRKEEGIETTADGGSLKGVIESYVKTVAENVLREAVEKTVSDLSEEVLNTVREIAREVVPNLARKLIKEEIGKIK